jgi:ribosomal protein L11 methyltransferase
MDSSRPAETDPARAWIELEVEVAEAAREAASDALWGLGCAGIEERHGGLLRGGDEPLLSGDPRGPQEAWRLAEAPSPDGRLTLRAWFREEGGFADDPARLLSAARNLLSEQGNPPSGVTIRRVVEQDWSAAWKAQWQPFQLSPRLLVVPAWLPLPEVAAGIQTLRVDPGQAFGTGTHFTTAACAQMLDDWMTGRPDRPAVLDVGSGSGILAIAALLLGAGRAVAVDPDPLAVDASRENAARNGVDGRIELRLGGIEAVPAGRFPLVLANLLAPLLIELAPALAERTGDAGTLLASGVLAEQAAAVVAALQAAGFELAEARQDEAGEWRAFRFLRVQPGERP